jgi:hypothetical protein
MPITEYVWSETSPSSPGTATSVNAVSGVSSGIANGVIGYLDDYRSLRFFAELTGATGGSLQVTIESSADGSNWYEYLSWPSITSGAGLAYYSASTSLSAGTSSILAVGKGSVSAIAANKVVGGAHGSMLRLLMTAGSGTTVGAPVLVRISAQRPRVREAGGR